MNRRTLLTGALSGSVVFLAGCIGGDNGPEDIVEQYLEAQMEGNEEEIESYVHGESSVSTSPNDNYESIISVEEKTAEWYADRFDPISESDMSSEWSSQADAVGADEWTYVVGTVAVDNLTDDITRHCLVGLVDDDWLIINQT